MVGTGTEVTRVGAEISVGMWDTPLDHDVERVRRSRTVDQYGEEEGAAGAKATKRRERSREVRRWRGVIVASGGRAR